LSDRYILRRDCFVEKILECHFERAEGESRNLLLNRFLHSVPMVIGTSVEMTVRLFKKARRYQNVCSHFIFHGTRHNQRDYDFVCPGLLANLTNFADHLHRLQHTTEATNHYAVREPQPGSLFFEAKI